MRVGSDREGPPPPGAPEPLRLQESFPGGLRFPVAARPRLDGWGREPENTAMPDAAEVRMEIKGLMLDPNTNVPIVVLRDEEAHVLLPIWIGVFEANAIALRLENVQTERPMTHDLLRAALEQLGGQIEKIVISELRDSTFYARIHVQRKGDAIVIDARPSDAIALALRAESPIFVLAPVLQAAQAVNLATSDEDKLKEWLEKVKPEDLGQYEM